MDAFQAVFLALVQGITEFLPVSSSAHLVLLPSLMQWPDQGIAFDVAVHLGTLCAVVFHYRASLAEMLRDLRRCPRRDNVVVLLAVASIPVLAAGYALENVIEQHLRTHLVIASTTVGFGLLLWAAVWRHARMRARHSRAPSGVLDLKSALVIGLAQTFALVPGTSRAGVTITAGLFLDLPREQAIHFSFLLAIPVILLATLYEAAGAGTGHDAWPEFALGFAVSAVFALLTIRLFLALTERVGLTPFIVYRLVLGALLFALVL